MQNENEWFYFINALDKKTCNKIRKLGKENWKEGQTFGSLERNESLDGIRKSDIVWKNDQWVYDTIWDFMLAANEQAGWKYDIRAAESMQITRYKKGEFYHFHRDGNGDHLSVFDEPDNKFKHGYVRKLSMTVLLNENYEGGEFQFSNYRNQKCMIHTPEFNKTGSIIIFPSYVEHRVLPVTKGTSYSLVFWFTGPPFV